MGCDIHYVLERRVKERPWEGWTGLYSSDALPTRPLAKQRDYAFFGEVASVRGERSPLGFFPRNLPKDVSKLAWDEYMSAPLDHHSVSHLSARDFANAWWRVQKLGDRKPKNHWGADITEKNVVEALLGPWDFYEENCKHEYRVVFWFDN